MDQEAERVGTPPKRASSGVRVLILSAGPVKSHMAGPAIRSWELARILSKSCQVTLLAPNVDPLPGEGFEVISYLEKEELARSALLEHDVLLAQGFIINLMPSLMELDKCIVIDLYDPITLEALHTYDHYAKPLQHKMFTQNIHALNIQLGRGDFFICGSEQQRDYWLGMLSANNRLNPFTHEVDSSFRSLIDVVSFGISSIPPQHTRKVLKGVHPKIAFTDKLIIWGGGVWDWFDPLTLIKALRKIAGQRSDVKLYFLGYKSPDPGVPPSQMAQAAIALSKELGLYEEFVFFNEWAPYADRQNYLLEADIGVSLHFDHLETRFALRTRLFDYIWTRLPMVVSSGDTMSQLLEGADVCKTVPIGDVNAVATALLELVDLPDPRLIYSHRFEPLIEQLTWESVTQPLVRYCQHPKQAPDLQTSALEIAAQTSTLSGPGMTRPATSPTPLWKLPVKVLYHLWHHGVDGLQLEIQHYLLWKKMQAGRQRK